MSKISLLSKNSASDEIKSVNKLVDKFKQITSPSFS